MIDKGESLIFGALNRVLDELRATVQDSGQYVQASSVLLVQPPSRRAGAAVALSEAAERLQGIAEACRSALQKLAGVLAVVERRKHGYQLALAPISCLPNELLCRIFEYATMGTPAVDNHAAAIPVVSLTHVCSPWRSIIHDVRSLWKDLAIDLNMPYELLHQYMEFSQGIPLHLTVRDRLPSLPLLSVHNSISRIDKAKNLSWTSSSRAYLEVATRALESFELRRPNKCMLCGVEWDESSGGMMECLLSDMTFPELLNLTLEHVDIMYLESIAAPILTSLHLRSVVVELDNFHTILQSLCTLQCLKLESLSGFYTGAAGQTLPQPVPDYELSQLHSLTISHTGNAGIEAARQLLCPARYPALTCWEYNDSSRGCPGHWGAIAELLRLFTEGSRKLEQITIDCPFQLLHGVFSGLDPWFREDAHYSVSALPHSLRTPMLRALSVSTTERMCNEDAHSREHMKFLVDVEQVLRHRRSGGLPILDTLKFWSCADDELLIKSLQSMVMSSLVFGVCHDGECPLPSDSALLVFVASDSDSDESE